MTWVRIVVGAEVGAWIKVVAGTDLGAIVCGAENLVQQLGYSKQFEEEQGGKISDHVHQDPRTHCLEANVNPVLKTPALKQVFSK